MKTLLMTLGMLASTALSAVAAQEYGYVGNATGGTVVVFDPATPALLASPPNPLASGLLGPRDTLAVPSLNRIYVVNSGAFTVTVISGSTLQVVNTIPLPNADVVGGMALAEDNSAIFVAGHNAALIEAGIWRIDLPAETAAWVAGIANAASALDCEVIRAGLVGGSGSGPGKVYWTVSPSNYIGFKNFVTGAAPNLINVPGASANSPTLIQRAPDSSFMLFGVTSALVGNAIGRIVPGATDTLDVVSMGGSTGGSTRDIAFAPGASPFRTFVLGADGGNRVYDFSSSAALGVFAPLNTLVAPQFGLAITLEPGANRVWLGDASGTANQVLPLDTTATPPTAGAGFTTGSGPVRVVFLPIPPAPTLDEACPKGQTDGAGATIRLRGSGFISSSQIRFGAGAGTIAIPTTFIDANNLDGNVAGLGSTTFDVIVENPDLQQARLNSFYRSVNAGTAVPSAFAPIQLPPLNAGYEMKSFPEYATIDELKMAFQTQLGPYNPMFYRVFFWYTDHYEELNTLSTVLDPCDLSGRAFYVLTRFGHPLSLAALDVTANTPSQLRVVPLMPGWNMFSQPWINVNNQITWANVRVTANGDLTGQVSASGFATLSPLPYQRVNKAYVTVNLLTAGEGYWVHNYHSGPLYLVFDSTLVTKPGGVSLQMNALAPGDPVPPPPPSGVTSSTDAGSSSHCGLLGPELLVVVAAFQGLRRRRRLGA